MRILFAIHTPKDPRSAVYGYVLQRTAFLEERGHETVVLAPSDFPAVRRLPPRWLPLAFPVALAGRLRREPVDLAVFHSFSGWAALLLRGRSKGPRVITQFHGLEPLFYRTLRDEMVRLGRPYRLRFRLFNEVVIPALLRFACRRSDRVLCLNSAEMRFLGEKGWAAPSRLALAANSVAPEFFLDRAYPAAASRLLFLGQWLEGKGTRYLADAFGSLAAEHPDLHLWCVGTRAEPEEVLQSFPPHLRVRVTAVRDADRQGILEHLARADVFVFPSLSEGFSLALLEAMAAGLPIVTTPVGAAPDLLAEGVSALFAPSSDAGALAAAVRRLLADAALREHLGRGARAAAEPYAWSRLREPWAALLEETAGESR
jgi:glycosyltransferase involved in cell wall biosynthesis